jgi:ligand-binding sensor domain-containing protein
MKNHLLNHAFKVSGWMLALLMLFSFGNPYSTDQGEEKNSVNKEKKSEPMPIYGNWKTIQQKMVLPSDKIYSVRVDEDRVWAGTNKGLALLENGKWTVFTEKDGLAHHNVLSIDISPITGDIWVATMSGLNVLSGGKFTTYNQFNSGLANDVVYSVICDGKDVWTATGGGSNSFDTYTGKWGIYTENNAPMHEPWTYNVCAGGGKIFIAAWGGGVIEYTKATRQFRDYTDPDGEMEIDLFPDDGVIHDITTAVSYANDILWVSSYFGMSRYDGARWKGYFDHDSGLAGNFINFLKANGPEVWVCSDNGLSSFNGDTWVTYRNDGTSKSGKVIIDGNSENERITKAANSIAHNFIIGVDFRDNEVWVATSAGLSRGEVIGYTETKSSKL